MKRLLKVLIVLAMGAAICLPSLAAADTLSFTATSSGDPNATHSPMLISQFNPSLGTLNQVSLSLDNHFTYQVLVFTPSAPATVNFTFFTG